MKKLIYLSMLAAALLAACGPQATPTMSPADVQATAFSAASTMVAMTQAAIPTATLPPPTETPSPTPQPTQTSLALPTSSTLNLPTVAPTSGPGGDPCNAYLSNPDGKPTTIKVDNRTKGALVFSLYLNKTEFGQCGFRGYNIARGESIIITDLVQGCYNASAYVNDPKSPSKAFGYGCINNDDKWTFIVSAENINLAPP